MHNGPLAPRARRHDIDALRALAFLLVILYHVGMYYVPGWHWHLKSPHAVEWLAWPMRLLNLWRMDLVFLISGVSLAMLMRRRANATVAVGALVSSRAMRLLLPLAVGMAVVVPYQAYLQGVDTGHVEPGFGAFLARYLGMRQHWPKQAFEGAEFGITWNHLWYLPYLFAYTALVAVLAPLWRARAGRWLRARFIALRGARLLLLPALPLLAYALWLQPRFPTTHDLLHDFYLHAMYFTLFLYGFWMGTDDSLWRELERLRRPALAIALVAGGGWLALRIGASVGAGAGLGALTVALRTVYVWCLIAAILGHAHRHLNRPWRWLAWANESVYPWYVLHQTLILALAAALAPLALGALPEAALLVAGTLAGCWAINDGLIRRVGWLRPLFGLKRSRRPGRPSPVAADGALSSASGRAP